MKVIKSEKRGYFENDWLKSFHSFSFADYYDPKNMNFRDLRVINHDFISPSSGFGTHPHRDMEIMTYVLKGQIEHQDSMGNKKTIQAGEIQVMSAGTGITHSEHNRKNDETLELLQIWITPEKAALVPSYEQKSFTEAEKKNQLKLLVSADKKDGSLAVHQDVKIYGSLLEKGKLIQYLSPAGRYSWLQLAEGQLEVNGEILNKGDAIALSPEDKALTIKGVAEKSDFILFDLR